MDSRLTPVDQRRGGSDRRSGVERRRWGIRHRPPSEGEPEGRETEPSTAHLRRLLPHAAFNDREAADRWAAIHAHHRELSARLERNVGLEVAAFDYLLNIRRDLVAPTIIEQGDFEVLEHRSVTDPLTGLYNRYHFEATLKREVAGSRRYRTPLTLLLVDVDRFKAVNDRWGHLTGDRVLGRVAGAVLDTLRTADVAARYGGDEFAIILPDTDARAGRLVAERICGRVAAFPWDDVVPGASGPAGVSVGLAELPLATTATSDTELIAAADRALYRAKGQGGNAVAEEVLP